MLNNDVLTKYLAKVHGVKYADIRTLGKNSVEVALRNDSFEVGEYEEIAVPNELGLPPYVYDVYRKVFLALFKENATVDKRAIEEKYYEVYHKPLGYWYFRQYLMPALRSASMITEETDPNDKRKALYYPTIAEKYIVHDSMLHTNYTVLAYHTIAHNISTFRNVDIDSTWMLF